MIATRLRGCVDLVFRRRGSRTVLAESRVEAPMTIVRPFDLPDGRIVVQLITLGPGLCAGDSVQVSVAADDGARAVVTTTAATRIMGMETGEYAEQRVVLRAGCDSTLEYYPCVTIPFPGSAFTQSVEVQACTTARIAVLENWALGRTARGEHLQFRRMSSRTTLSVGGVVCYDDATHLEPAACNLDGAGILAGHRYLAAGFWYGVTLPPSAATDRDREDVLIAFGQSRPGLAYLRALGRDGPALDAVLRQSAETVAATWNLPPFCFDRFKS